LTHPWPSMRWTHSQALGHQRKGRRRKNACRWAPGERWTPPAAGGAASLPSPWSAGVTSFRTLKRTGQPKKATPQGAPTFFTGALDRPGLMATRWLASSRWTSLRSLVRPIPPSIGQPPDGPTSSGPLDNPPLRQSRRVGIGWVLAWRRPG
jgi:hypothetical protein